jgi:single-strand DNA-binding protein
MPNFNRVLLIGHLTADPQPRPTTSYGVSTVLLTKPLCTFRLAVNHTFKNKQGSLEQRVCFVDVATWGTLAQTCAKSLKKGKPVFVEGRLELSTWEKDDQVHSKLQVYALKVLFLSPPAKADDSQAIDDLSLPAAAQKSEPQPE